MQDLERQRDLLKQYAYLPKERVNLATTLQVTDGVEEDVATFKELCAYAGKVGRLQEAVQDSEQRLVVLQALPQAAAQLETVHKDLTVYGELREYGMSLGAGLNEAARLKGAARLLDPVRKVAISAFESEVSQYGCMLEYEQTLGSQQKHLVWLEQERAVTETIAAFDVVTLSASVDSYKEMTTALNQLAVQQRLTAGVKESFITAQESYENAVKDYEAFVAEFPTCPLCGNLLPCADSEEVLV